MGVEILKHIIRFIVLVLVQVLIINQLELSRFVNPYIYVLFMLALPLETPKWALLVLGFALGLAVDIFMNTAGIHASATVFLAFCRPYVLNFLSPREGYETGTVPTLGNFSLNWYVSYAGTLVFLHHVFLFNVESFRLSEFFTSFTKAVISGVFTVAILVIIQFMSLRSER